jgi:hypothetical protein
MEMVDYEVGDKVGIYEVVEPRGFSGTLPVARIRPGNPNAGLLVILTRPQKRKES